MEEIIRLKDQFYVLATSSLADQRTRVLKEGDSFAVFDVYGNIQPIGLGVQGLYDGATRFLSYLELRLHNVRPLLLSSTVRSDNTLLTVDLMNRDTVESEEHGLLPGTLHIFRSKFLWDHACHERVRISSFHHKPVELALSFRYKCDFADIFEIRGSSRKRRGELLPAEVVEGGLVLGYRGLDGVVRRARFEFSPRPDKIEDAETCWISRLPPNGTATIFLSVTCETGPSEPRQQSYTSAFSRAARAMQSEKERECELVTSNTQFNEWLKRSRSDLHMMLTRTPYGQYPYAGVPLFNTVFGRDGLITAFQMLWAQPEIARGVLAYLAATQAKELVPEQDAEPGKILHEVRSGEMVELGEVPFRRYYGSVDSTPLFLILAAAYYERTGDAAFLDTIWPHLVAALSWIDEWGDRDGDGFVEYERRCPNGLVNQGWKDSHDSVFHYDGSLAEGPIALCEIQGYVYDAKLRMADLFSLRGESHRGRELAREAEELRQRFERVFWVEELGTYALALDGGKRPCRVRSSNAGHSLFSGIASRERAARVADMLLSDAMFSGWGIRTIAQGESRYNPMSYHNGSIWPHDNSLIAEGLARYDRKDAVNRLLTSFFDAAVSVDLNRLPELFCGFERRIGDVPTLYPVACSPQSWASAAVMLLLKAALGLSVQGSAKRVSFTHPELPEGLDEVRVRNLRVGDVHLDLALERRHHDVGINIVRRSGPVEIVVVK